MIAPCSQECWTRLTSRTYLFIVLALMSFTAILPLYGQSFRGSIVGTVLDQSGAAIPNAPV